MRSISAQEIIDEFRAFINTKDELTAEQKTDLVEDLERSLDECDRRYYETKAVIAGARERRNQAIGPISRFIFKLLRI